MRFLMLVKHGENPGPPPPEFLEAMAKLGEDAAKSGTMIASGGLVPISKSTRVRLARGQVTAIDGPYTDAKEVVGGDGRVKPKSGRCWGRKLSSRRRRRVRRDRWPGRKRFTTRRT